MKALEEFINFILPPRCIVNGDLVDEQGMLSPEAWAKLNFIDDPQCYRCGYPFDFDASITPESSVCAACFKEPPIYKKARSAVVYDDVSRNIILGFKHADQTITVPSFIPWLNRAGHEILDQADFIVPVPLHKWRLLKRRYNQSALIVKYLSSDTKILSILDLLIRTRATETQGHLRANQRHRNVKNAFVANDRYIDVVKQKNIVLIDDVYTTGSTVNECTKALLKAGVGSVSILTLARVVKPVRY